MQSVLTPQSEVSRAQQTKSNNDVETTGSLAMGSYTPLFDVPVVNYDMFVPTNPFSLNIDYGSYAAQADGTLANNSTFMQGFAQAMSMLYEGGASYGSYGSSSGAAVASAGCAGGSCSVGGGFTSVG